MCSRKTSYRHHGWCALSRPDNTSASQHQTADYAVFASPDFEANDYANAILAGEPYPPQPGASKANKPPGLEPAAEDISIALGKLDTGIEDVSKQIKNVVRVSRLALVLLSRRRDLQRHRSLCIMKGYSYRQLVWATWRVRLVPCGLD